MATLQARVIRYQDGAVLLEVDTGFGPREFWADEEKVGLVARAKLLGEDPT